MEKKFKTSDGIKIAYHLWNGNSQKRWIVFIHGLGGNLTAWDPLLKNMKLDANLLALDLRGQGHSQRKKKKELYTFEKNADDVIELLNHLDIKKAILAGHSSGASVAMDVAIRHPKRVESLLLLSPETQSPLKGRLIPEFLLKAVIYSLSSILLLLSHVFPHKKLTYPNYGRLKSSSGLFTFYNDMLGNNLDIYVWNLREFLSFSVNPKRIHTPSLVVYGSNDWIIQQKRLLDTCKKIKECTIQKLDNCGHQVMFDRKKEVIKIIKEFVEAHK